MSPALPKPAPAREPVGDWQAATDWAGFALRAVKRHRRRVLTVFAVLGLAGGAGALTMPRTYHVETKLLAQPNFIMPALGNPGRSVPGEADAPTRAASETVMQRDSLVSVIRNTRAVERWEASRGTLARAKDAVARLVRGPPTDADREDALIGLLEKRLSASTSERTVTIALDWPEPQLAFDLVQASEENFLELRRESQISSIQATIQILETHAERERAKVDEALEAYRQAQSESGRAPKTSAAHAEPAPPRHPSRSRARPINLKGTVELESLKSQLEVKRHALASLDEDRQRNLADLQRKLTEARTTYGPAHPVIVGLTQSIGRLEHEPAEVSALRDDVKRLEAAVLERTGELPPPLRAQQEPRPAAPVEVIGSLQGLAPPTAAEDLAAERLRMVEAKYGELLGRIDAARIELDTAEAAFKFRYSVVTPAELPRKPSKNPAMAVLGALVLALFAGFGSALLADLRRGRLVEPWQIERRLNLPVLAEVESR